MHRIQLDNEVFEGENAVYLLGHDGPGPTTLIDTGFDSPGTEATLRDGLAAVDVEFADVDRVLLTHFHRDHAGLAGAIREESGATVCVHEADAAMVADPDARDAYFDRLERFLDRWKVPGQARDNLLAYMRGNGGETAAAVPVETVVAGDTVEAGGRDLEVVHLPGHTAGQTGFLDQETGDLYAGDAVLPVYTPNVGGADVRVEDAVAQYADSLRRVVDLAPARILPGHRMPIDEPVDRAREILDHHRERTGRVVDVLREHGPADVWTVSAHLFGDLENIHVLHGPGEASAHLEHLVDAGLVERTDGVYGLTTDESLDVDEVLPGAG